jgi:hypothetical protein
MPGRGCRDRVAATLGETLLFVADRDHRAQIQRKRGRAHRGPGLLPVLKLGGEIAMQASRNAAQTN